MTWTPARYTDHFASRLGELQKDGRYRTFAVLERLRGEFPHALMHGPFGHTKRVVVWCSNDYLGMGQHPVVIGAMKDALDHWGAGSGGTRNISGNAVIHTKLEQQLAGWHGKEAALLFTSGYTANEGALGALIHLMPGCIVFSDEKNHASMIAGITKHHPHKRIYAHNDMQDLETKLRESDPFAPKLIACESVYSMDGTVAPLCDVATLARKYGALTYLDEVHAVGLYGPNGAGIAERDGVAGSFDIIEANFGKSFGVSGGYVAGSAVLIDAIRSHAPDFIFTTSLSPAIAAGALASLGVLREAHDLRARQQKQAQRLKDGLKGAGLPYLPTETHIVPLMVGGAHCCKGIADWLFEEANIYVQPINFPTVPVGQERLRLTPTPFHTDEMVDGLLAALDFLWTEQHLPRRLAA